MTETPTPPMTAEPLSAAEREEVRRLATEAPQRGPFGINGPWHSDRGVSPTWTVEHAAVPLGTIADVSVFGGGEAQAAYIAAASPDRLLRLLQERDRLAEAAQTALNELGVPSGEYPAPVANAVAVLRAALSQDRKGAGE